MNETLTTSDYIGMSMLLVPIILVSFYFFFQVVEVIYIRNKKKPIFVFVSPAIYKLNDSQREIVNKYFSFYTRLKPKYKRYFEHRMLHVLNTYQFTGNQITITDEMKICIAATYVQLTFGMRKYLIYSFSKIIIYPDVYYSEITKQYHRGEFNPKMKVVVFAWNYFKEGLEITNDNLNLGLHEFTHVLHLEALKRKNHTLVLFEENLQNLFKIVSQKEVKEQLLSSNFFRSYAYESQFEFVAVLLEYFFESNVVFKEKFPIIYQKVKQMINYNENCFIS